MSTALSRGAGVVCLLTSSKPEPQTSKLSDEQEVAAAGDTFPKTTVAAILSRLSYSSSFLGPVNQAAAKKKVNQAYWALAQYDFAYNPERVRGAVAKDPLFLGVFDWNDSEDASDI